MSNGNSANSAPKTVTYLSHDGKDTKLHQLLLGTVVVGSFIVIWLSSLFSPIIFYVSYRNGYYTTFAIAVSLSILSYIPWKNGRIVGAIKYFYVHYHMHYYKKVTVEFEGNTLPSPKDPQTFYAIHPHGAFSYGWSILFCSYLLSHVRFCFAPALYFSPFFRLFSRTVGTPGSASKSDMIQYLKKGEHLALPPGGFEEATLTSTTQDRVFIKKRFGFIRLCLKYGVAVRPVYAFGEKSLFSNVQGMFKTRLKLNRSGLPAILVWGHPLFPLLPKSNKSLHIVVGAPIVLPKIENPTKEEVSLWHQKYISALTKLFEEHKEAAYGDAAKTCKLEVW